MPASIAHPFEGSWGFTSTDYTWRGPNWIVSRAVSALAKSAEGRRPVGLALPATNVGHDSPISYPFSAQTSLFYWKSMACPQVKSMICWRLI